MPNFVALSGTDGKIGLGIILVWFAGAIYVTFMDKRRLSAFPWVTSSPEHEELLMAIAIGMSWLFVLLCWLEDGWQTLKRRRGR